LIDWLEAPEQRHLRRAFTVWLKRVFLPGRVPGMVFDELQDLQEVDAMLAERVKEWAEEWKRQGLQEGIQEGLQQGLQQGEAAIVLRLLERRFGALDETVRQRIQAADAETLLLWGERVLIVQVLADVFEA
jgi:flagellar biosynthesis/type III secretory pathway protein FliH